jgi:hypothetical protein
MGKIRQILTGLGLAALMGGAVAAPFVGAKDAPAKAATTQVTQKQQGVGGTQRNTSAGRQQQRQQPKPDSYKTAIGNTVTVKSRVDGEGELRHKIQGTFVAIRPQVGILVKEMQRNKPTQAARDAFRMLAWHFQNIEKDASLLLRIETEDDYHELVKVLKAEYNAMPSDTIAAVHKHYSGMQEQSSMSKDERKLLKEIKEARKQAEDAHNRVLEVILSRR